MKTLSDTELRSIMSHGPTVEIALRPKHVAQMSGQLRALRSSGCCNALTRVNATEASARPAALSAQAVAKPAIGPVLLPWDVWSTPAAFITPRIAFAEGVLSGAAI